MRYEFMNFKQASKVRDDYAYLEGTLFKGKQITIIEVVPNTPDGVGLIGQALYFDKPVKPIQALYDDFVVIAYLDLDEFGISGVMNWQFLQKILDSQ